MNPNDSNLFSCPKCLGDLELIDLAPTREPDRVEEGALICPVCALIFPVWREIPLLCQLDYCPEFDSMDFKEKWRDIAQVRELDFYQGETNPEKYKQAKFFTEDAEYDDDVADSIFWRAADATILTSWKDLFQDGATLVDVGCGTGRVTIPFAQEGHHVMGTDISLGMLLRACAKAKESGRGDLTFFLADAENLPLKSNCFNGVISYGMLHHVDEPENILRQARRVLFPGGRFLALENHASVVRFVFDFLMRRNKLWVEEAGSHPLFKLEELRKMAKDTSFSAEITTSIFLPPHLLNIFGYSRAKKIIALTDRMFGRLPLTRAFGGQVVLKAMKEL